MQHTHHNSQPRAMRRLSLVVMPLLLILLFFVVAAVFGAAGDLDQTFGEGGVVTTNIGTSSDTAEAMVVQSDGKIILVGHVWAPGGDFALARYNADGSPDAEFGRGGMLNLDQTVGNLFGVTLQASGRIVSVGYDFTTDLDDPTLTLVGITPEGELDPTFGDDGFVRTNIITSTRGYEEKGYDITVQDDGKLVAVGDQDNGDCFIARYDQDGVLDTSFADYGVVLMDLGGTDSCRSVEVQDDGKVVIGGTSNNDFAVARYDTTGAADSGFGTNGVAIVDAGGYEYGYDLVLQPDGKIVVGGGQFLARLHSNGTLDADFGEGGIASSESSDVPVAGSAIAMQADNQILMAGRATIDNVQFALTRFQADGDVDTNFGDNGTVTTAIGNFSSSQAVVVTDGGKIFAGGWGASDFALARYNGDGTLDTSFANGGFQTSDIGGDDSIEGMALQSDGKIVAVGDSYTSAGYLISLARYNSGGELDGDFGQDGVVALDLSMDDHYGVDVGLLDSGKIMVLGEAREDLEIIHVLARLDERGALDNSFGTDGIVETLSSSPPRDLVIQSDGQILVVTDRALYRHHSDGTLDSDFGSNGNVASPLGFYPTSAVIQSDGKIVLTGYVGYADFSLVRYEADGGLDTSFGVDGTVVTSISDERDYARDVAQDAEGRLVVVGDSEAQSLVIARYTAEGALDENFGADGVVMTAVPGGAIAQSVAIQEDGKIVVAGHTDGFDSNFVVARYNNDGTLDDTFGNGGIAITDVARADSASTVMLQDDDQIVVAGASNGDFALLRIDANLKPVTDATINAPTEAVVNNSSTFTATVSPTNIAFPVTYEWEATGQSPITRVTNELSDSVSFSWSTSGPKEITVTADNGDGSVSATHMVMVVEGEMDTVTPDGGGAVTHTGEDGTSTTIQVPSGAVTETTTLVYTPLENPSTENELNFAGIAFDLNAYREGESLDDFTFEQPVTVTITYDEESTAGIEESELKLYVQEGDVWVDAATTCTPPLPYTRNPEENELGVSICHLSRFALLGPDGGHQLFLPMLMR